MFVWNIPQIEEQELLAKMCAFPNAAVDRIVPIQIHDERLKVTVEPFFEWIIDRSAFLGDIPHIQGATFVDHLTSYIERKLFTLNIGHATVARGPIRKLGPNDRFISPAQQYMLYVAKEPVYMAQVIADALNYDYAEDEEAMKLQERILQVGYENTLCEITGLDQTHPLFKLVNTFI
jgi:mannitol-1-phosphate/altronate dehydrogenase